MFLRPPLSVFLPVQWTTANPHCPTRPANTLSELRTNSGHCGGTTLCTGLPPLCTCPQSPLLPKLYQLYHNFLHCGVTHCPFIKYLLPSGPCVPQKVSDPGTRVSSPMYWKGQPHHGNPLKHTRTFTQLGGWEWQIQSHPEPHCSLREADVILLRLCGLNGIDYLKILDMTLLAFSHCIKRSRIEAEVK